MGETFLHANMGGALQENMGGALQENMGGALLQENNNANFKYIVIPFIPSNEKNQ